MDIANSGRVSRTVFLGVNEIGRNLTRLKNGNSFYQGAHEPSAFDIFKGDLLFTPRDGDGKEMLATLAGAGNKNQAPYAIFTMLYRFCGIAADTRRYGYSDYTQRQGSPDTAVAAIVGGVETIMNTGNFMIRAGDLVVIEAPLDQRPSVANFIKGNAQAGNRLLPLTVPLDDARDILTHETFPQLMIEEATSSAYERNKAPLVEGAKMVNAGLMEVALLGVVFAIENGFVAPANKDDTASSILLRMSRALGLMSSKPNAEVDVSMREDLSRMFTGSKMVVARDDHGNAPRGGSDAVLFRNQKQVLQTIFRGIRKADDSVNERCIGRAQTQGMPKKPFDLEIGRPYIH